jgi:hypothetical protein
MTMTAIVLDFDSNEHDYHGNSQFSVKNPGKQAEKLGPFVEYLTWRMSGFRRMRTESLAIQSDINEGTTEVIPVEWEDSNHKKGKKFLALMSGIVSILAKTQYTITLRH